MPWSRSVEVVSGLLELPEPDVDGIRVFKGIPYAAPPVGPLRWRAPQAPLAWRGVRPIDRFGPRCMQSGRLGNIDPENPLMGEDCLYLNVLTPAETPDAALPVYVWIHGGSYTIGSGSEPWYQSRGIARRGVVMVTLNYRLDVFGFFAHPDLGGAMAGSGDFGLLDQIAALEWVQQNIAAFGGDPMRVTVGGESVGAASVSLLMASPRARGLFRGIIAQSAAFWRRSSIHGHLPLAEAEAVGRQFQNDCRAPSLDALRACSAEALLAHSQNLRPKFLPVINGAVSPRDPMQVFLEGKQNDVPLLAGWNAHEGSIFGARLKDVDRADFGRHAARRLNVAYSDLAKIYSLDGQDGAQAAIDTLLGDEFVDYPMWKWLEMQIATGTAPVYQYYFNWRPPAPELSVHPLTAPGVFHSAELYYMLDALHTRDWPWRREDEHLRDLMVTLWTNFIRSGDPNGRDCPLWPDRRQSHLVATFEPECMMRSPLHVERYRFLDRAYDERPPLDMTVRTFG